MNETINDKFNSFLRHTDPELVDKWEKFKSKTPRKNPYIFFREEIRDIVKEENPSFNSKEVTEECGKKWSELKEKGGPEYEKYTNMSKAYSKHGTDPEITKPFHSFSLANRANLVNENPDKKATEITEMLKELWHSEDKEKWKI